MATALLDVQVDLNPHQIDAAMFATSSPLSKGAILADEAGLLIAQRWAERKRRILVIPPVAAQPKVTHGNPPILNNSAK